MMGRSRRSEISFLPALALAGLLAGTVHSCALLGGISSSRKMKKVQTEQMAAHISLPGDEKPSVFRQLDTTFHEQKDTITVNIDGHEMVLMKAVLDDDTGEMVAAQELRAAVVTARFRNVAERHGKVDLEFQITVPREMQDPQWQLRFYPDMYILGDSLRLDNVIITGADYRKAQLRGYQQYERFLSRIVSDTTKFIDLRNLDIWIARNIPGLYAFKTDSTFVSDEQFESCFGVTEKMAIEHYTDKFSKNVNERRKARKDKMWRKYVKSPIVTEHIRLDTIIQNPNGDFVYNYIQTIQTRKGLKKVDIVLSGEIFQQEKKLYIIPPTEPLTFYISSLSSFVDGTERYLTKVIERRAEANAAWYIDFRVGKADIEEDLSDNARQIANIKENLRGLLSNQIFDLDSITIAAFASPEGSVAANDALSERRARSVEKYFGAFVKGVRDSIRREEGYSISVADDFSESKMTGPDGPSEIRFKSSAGGENWFFLEQLVETDSLLTRDQKDRYFDLTARIPDLDSRERALQKEPFYSQLRGRLYPLLRTVQFNFYLHRKGMVKDTVHTTVLDTAYMRGVQAIRDRDYEAAVALLMPYNDYNTAIAYVSLDRNASAMAILRDLPRTAQVNYMLAILYARKGDAQNAVQCYMTSCSQDPSYVHRGNLDPEIAELIRRYGLNRQDDDMGDLL